MSRFIVLEGIEGSGKSTQVRLLAEWLQAHGIPHVVTREPGGTETGEEIRNILLHGRDMPAEAELLLMNAARAVLVAAVVRPALAGGKVVVADRFVLSTLAYQGFGRGLSLERVRQVCDVATAGLLPDLTLVVDVTLAEGAARRTARRRADRIEAAGDEFHRRVAEAYRLLPDSETGVLRVSGAGEPTVVHERILLALQSHFPETFDPRRVSKR